jgi:hypothetical protein
MKRERAELKDWRNEGEEGDWSFTLEDRTSEIYRKQRLVKDEGRKRMKSLAVCSL